MAPVLAGGISKYFFLYKYHILSQLDRQLQTDNYHRNIGSNSNPAACYHVVAHKLVKLGFKLFKNVLVVNHLRWLNQPL